MAYRHKKSGHLYRPAPGSAWERRVKASDDFEKVNDSELKKAEKEAEKEAAPTASETTGS